MLGSVTPMIRFSKYIEVQKPDLAYLLKFVKLSKIFQELLEDLEMIE